MQVMKCTSAQEVARAKSSSIVAEDLPLPPPDHAPTIEEEEDVEGPKALASDTQVRCQQTFSNTACCMDQSQCYTQSDPHLGTRLSHTPQHKQHM